MRAFPTIDATESFLAMGATGYLAHARPIMLCIPPVHYTTFSFGGGGGGGATSI